MRRQIADRGVFPVWRGDGDEIVYYDMEQIWSVSVTPFGDRLHFGAPTALFAVGKCPGLVARLNPLAITRDGSRIFFPCTPAQWDQKVIHVSSGWAPSA